tara:strand:+ start:1529 stop:2302 length:774 start_codon:yes stop_codon:yes gene_type:complete
MTTNPKINHSNTEFMQEWAKKNLEHFNFINLSYMHIDLVDSVIQMLSYDLQWYKLYWEEKLDYTLAQRLKKKYTLWSELDEKHQSILHNYQSNSEKVDLCLFHQKAFEIFSIHTCNQLHMEDYLSLYQCFPSISYHAHKIRKRQHKYLLHPIHDQNIFTISPPNNTHHINTIFQTEKRYRFNQVNLTALEIKYLQCLSALMSQKEIAYRYQVSETAVRKTIGNIKRKMGHEAMPNSKLFKLLREQGITRMYLNHLIS